jgi:DNA-binding GntR family transcriptional regulator
MPVAMQMIESLWLQAGPHLNLCISEVGFAMGGDHHHELVEALARHDVKAVRTAIEADISDAAKVIRKFLESRKVTAA